MRTLKREVQKAGSILANLQNAWRSAAPEEKQELCSIIFEKIVYDFEVRKIVNNQPKSEYKMLFKMANEPMDQEEPHAQ